MGVCAAFDLVTWVGIPATAPLGHGMLTPKGADANLNHCTEKIQHRLPDSLHLPLLEAVLPDGLNFGANYLVEFEPQSLWYEVSLTLMAQALKAGYRSDYHTFTHIPDDVRTALTRQGADVRKFEERDDFRIWDSYTVQGGIDVSAKIGKVFPRERVDLRSVKMSDWDKGGVEELRAKMPQIDLERLHIDDNTSVLLQYNSEKEVVDHFRTITVQHARISRLALFYSLVSGIYTENLYRQFESFSDGIIDFKSTEEGGKLKHRMRIRVMRGREHDSRWVDLELQPNGEVRAVSEPAVPYVSPIPEKTPGIFADQMGMETARLLAGTSVVNLSRYRVVGNYSRFEEGVRNILKDLKQSIVNDLRSSTTTRANYLLWSVPGGGKTFLVQQLAASLAPAVDYVELNLTANNEDEFRAKLVGVDESRKAVICLVDEIDAKQEESWPYEALLTHLEGKAPANGTRMFILAGSSGNEIEAMKKIMKARPKGSDLLSRVPARNEYTIPPMTPGDRLIVTLVSLKSACGAAGKDVSDVEKAALFYIILNPSLSSARQLSSFSGLCARRVQPSEDRIKYDTLFEPGDSENKEFWVGTKSSNPELIDSYIHVAE